MKKKYLFLASLVFTSFMTQSCKDFLDEKNKQNVSAESFYSTKDGFNSLMVANYAQWKNIYGRSMPYFFTMGTDIYTVGNDRAPWDMLRYSTLNPRTEHIDEHYAECTKIIQKANMGLYYSKNTDQNNPDLKASVGALKFFRAFAYFFLVQDYGGVPIITDYIDELVQSFDRNTAEEVYDLIIKDLTEAIELLPDVSYASTDGHVVKRSAQHLLAKVYLTRGYEKFAKSDDFANAAKYADLTINGESLSIPYDQLWKPGNEFNDEVLFSIQYSKDLAAQDPLRLGHNQSSTIGGGSNLGGKDVPGAISKNQDIMLTRRAYELFNDPTDVRRDVTFMTEQYEKYTDGFLPEKEQDRTKLEFFFEPPWFTDADSAAYVQKLLVEGDTVDFSYRRWKSDDDSYIPDEPYYGNWADKLIIKKFDDPDAPNDMQTNTRDIIVMRLGETYLIAAEAYLQAGDKQKGLDRLNAVRARAKAAPATLAEFDIYYILDERVRELLGEYMRWYDLKRTGKLEELAVKYNSIHVKPGCFDGANGHKRYLRPIPQSALDLNHNKNFPQNPAYVY